MFDVFIATLKCPDCATMVPDAEIQTHVRGGAADSSGLRVGFEFDPIDLATESILASGYALVKSPDADGPIRLLDTWAHWKGECKTDQ